MEPSEGSIPKDIEGTFFKNGPAKFKVRYLNIKTYRADMHRSFDGKLRVLYKEVHRLLRTTKALERPTGGKDTRRAVPS